MARTVQPIGHVQGAGEVPARVRLPATGAELSGDGGNPATGTNRQGVCRWWSRMRPPAHVPGAPTRGADRDRSRPQFPTESRWFREAEPRMPSAGLSTTTRVGCAVKAPHGAQHSLPLARCRTASVTALAGWGVRRMEVGRFRRPGMVSASRKCGRKRPAKPRNYTTRSP